MVLFDTHCHLDLAHFDDDIENVITRARESGVSRMLIPAVDLAGFERIYEIALKHEGIYCAIGIHPNSADEWDENSKFLIEKYLEADRINRKIVAIGEIGLDNYWKTVPLEAQIAVLKEQLVIAQNYELPVIIHSREENNDRQGECSKAFNPILTEWIERLPVGNRSKTFPGVFHSYGGDVELAKKLLGLGFNFGFTGPITYKTAEINREVVKFLPDHKILIETDSPYLSPVPHRGKRNEPAFVTQVALRIAEILNEKPEKIADLTTTNALKLFFGEVID